MVEDVSTNLKAEVIRATTTEQTNAENISSNKTATDISFHLKSDLDSPSFIGIPTAPTAVSTNNTTQIATTAFVQTRIGRIIDDAPTALDTLKELADALGSDANFSTTITNMIGDVSNNLETEINRATTAEQDNATTISDNLTATDNSLNLKADLYATDTSLNLRADLAATDTSLNLKADLAATDNSLNLKANLAATDTSLNFKADLAATDNSLLLKANLAATDTSLNLKANLDSPTFTGIPTADTAASGTDDTQLATTAFVNRAVELGNDIVVLSRDISVNGITVGRGSGDVITNTVVGYEALVTNNGSGGVDNVAVGYEALTANQTGRSNVANGYKALTNNTLGSYNVANGVWALVNNISGGFNVANGYNTLGSNETGRYNVATGYQSGLKNTTGDYNTFLGSNTDLQNSGDTYEYSTALGYGATISASNQIMLGRSNETVEVPGSLTVDGGLTVDGNVDVCGNFYAQYPDKSINVTALKNNNNLSDTTYNTFVITVSSSKYFVNGIQQDTIVLYRGLKYSFDVTDNTTDTHPFYIQTTDNAGQYDSGNVYNDGVTNNGATAGSIEFIVPDNAADILYYRCELHSGMGGIINIQNYLLLNDNLLLGSTLDVTGAATMSNTLDVTGDVTLSSTLDVTGAATMGNTLDVTGAATMGNTLDVTGAATMGNTLDVTGDVTLSSTLDVTGAATMGNTLDVTGAATMGNTLKVNNTLTVSNETTLGSTLMVSNAATMGNTLKLNDTLTVSKASTLSSTLDVYNATTLNSTLDVTGKTILHNDVSMNGHVDISGDLIINGNLSVYQYDDVKTINTTVNEYTSIVTEDISLNGKLSVSGDASFNGDLYVTNAATLSSTLSVSKAATLSSTLKVSGASTMDSTLTVAGASTLSSTLAVSKAATLSSTLNVNGASTMDNTLTVSNASTLSSTLAVSKAATLSSTLNVSGASTMDSTLTVAGASTLSSTLAVSKAATLSSTLNVTGASTMNNTLTLAGASTLNSTLAVSKAATLSSTLNVIGASTMNGTLTVAGASTLSSTLTVSKSATLSSTLNVNGASTMNSTLTVVDASTMGSTLSVSKAATLSSTLNVSGASTMNNTLTVANATTLSSTLNVSKAVMFSSALTVTGKTTFENDVSLNGNLNMNGDVSLNSNLYVKDSIQIDKMTIANEPPGPDKWTQLGQAIIGESVDSNLGAACALSNDGSTLASMTNMYYKARYFFIQLETPSIHLVESEIEIYDENGTNIALNKTPVIQSSYNNIGTYPASKGNNGSTDGSYENIFTDNVSEERGWWAVDLGSDQTIASIKVFGFYTTSYIPGGATYSRTAPFRIFLYEDADYPNGSFTDGGTSGGPGPLNYNDYELHSGDATDSSIINGNQQVFTFNHFNTALKLYRYSSSDSIWAQIGSIDGIARQPIADKIVSLSNDGSTVALSSYNTSSTFTARYFFIQLDTENELLGYSEIEIYDENGTNIALNKTTIVSSLGGTDYPSSNTIDGITDGTTNSGFTSSDSGQRSWLGMELESNIKITSIKVFGHIKTTDATYLPGGVSHSRVAPFRIFLYEDGDYPESSFIDGGTGPLNYGNYQLHSGDATDSSTINGNQQVFTFNTFPIGNVRVFQYDNSNNTWPQLGQTIQNEIRHNGGITTSLTNYNDSTTVALSSYDTSSTYTARYFFIQLETMTSMHFAEIQIFDETGTNLSSSRTAVQSSSHTTASNSVNDDTADFHHTSSSSTERPWLGVDLGEKQRNRFN